MKKIILVTALALSIIGAVYIYNSVIAKVNNEIREDTKNISKNTRKIKFMHWAYFPEEIFRKFNQKNPEIIVDYEQINEQYYHDMQKLRIVSGDQIDVMGVLRNDYNEFIIRGYLTALTGKSYMNNYEDAAREELKSLALSRREYAIPYQSWVLGVWYNKILFNKYNIEVPKNYTEFIEACRQLKRNGVDPLILGARDEWASGYVYLLRLYSLLDQDKNRFQDIKMGRAKWTDPEVQDVFGDIAEFVKEGYIAENSLSTTYHQAFTELVKGRAAMVITGDWSINLVQKDIESISELGVFPIPYNVRGKVSEVPANTVDMLTGIYKGSYNKEIGELFLEHLSTPETARMFSDANTTVLPIKGLDYSKFKYNALWEPLRKMDKISPVTTEMDYEFLKLFNKSAKELIAGEKDPMEILDEFQSLQQELLNKKYN